jgi:sulfite exporter TauE/SafE
MTELLAGLLLGLAGSLHCAAMCGPLTLALRGGVRTPGRPGSVLPLFAIYHAGRVAMYAAAGLAAGSAGHVVASLGAGRLLAWLAGGALILGGAAHLGLVPALPVPPLARPIAGLARIGRRVGAQHPAAGAFAGGVLNAWLPCGMLYAALTAAAALGRPGAGLVFMALFGLGTTPALATVWLLAEAVTPGLRRGFRYGAPVALVLVGLLLIARAYAGPSSPGHAAMPHAHGPAVAGS